jgi:YidC/Oxa1 family membrane protein insertase
MTSSTPEPGPGSALQRALPLLVLGLTFVLIFSLFPQFFGSPSPEPADTGAVATATPVAPVAAPQEVDDSTRTYIWNLILVGPLENGLRFLANTLGLGAGSAIILFTIIVKMVLLPLTIQQLRSMKAMQRLQPEIKALQKKYAEDREKIGAETMALYKQHGVNPAAGCFPILLQMPVLFGLYAALNNLGTQPLPENEAFTQPWLWIQRINQPDVITMVGSRIVFGPTEGGITLPFLLPIFAAATQWVQQRMMTMPSDDPQQRMQNSIMQFMPLMMLWFGLTFSAGLALYWTTQNVVGIIQQYFATGWGSLFPNRVARYGGLVGGRAKPESVGSPEPDGSASLVPADTTEATQANGAERTRRPDGTGKSKAAATKKQAAGTTQPKRPGTERGNKPGRKR